MLFSSAIFFHNLVSQFLSSLLSFSYLPFRDPVHSAREEREREKEENKLGGGSREERDLDTADSVLASFPFLLSPLLLGREREERDTVDQVERLDGWVAHRRKRMMGHRNPSVYSLSVDRVSSPSSMPVSRARTRERRDRDEGMTGFVVSCGL